MENLIGIASREEVMIGKHVRYYPYKNCPEHLIKIGIVKGYYNSFGSYFLVIVQFGTDIITQGVDPDYLEYLD